WDEDLASGPFDHVDQGGALLRGRLDVEEDELVRALLGVGPRHLDRVALVTQLEEMRALDHTATRDVETGNDPLEQHALPLSPSPGAANTPPPLGEGRVGAWAGGVDSSELEESFGHVQPGRAPCAGKKPARRPSFRRR